MVSFGSVTFRPRHIRRLLQALLACVAVMMVVAPEIGTTAAHETSALAAGSPGSPPRVESSASVSQVGPQHLEPTFVVGLERTRLDYRSPLLVREILLVTNTMLC